MSIQNLTSSRVYVGEFFKQLKIAADKNVAYKIGHLVPSEQETETYRWLSMAPAPREWVGPRAAKGLTDFEMTLKNVVYESTLEFNCDDLRRDKSRQALTRIAELARRMETHWMKLLSTLISAGAATTCYDGEYFFDTDHSEGNNSTNQSNDLSVDISELPVSTHGIVTAPSSEEAMQAIWQAITAIQGFKDNENEPMGADAKAFMVVAPLGLVPALQTAISASVLTQGVSNSLLASGYNLELYSDAFSSGTDTFHVFRTDAEVKAFVLQEELPVQMTAIAEGSELEFNENMHRYGVKAIRAAGYGFWQMGCQVQLI